MLRAVGDVASGALSWLSRIGLGPGDAAYSGELVAGVLIALGVVDSGSAAPPCSIIVTSARGFAPRRPGPGLAGLWASLGLAWRLQRGTSVLGGRSACSSAAWPSARSATTSTMVGDSQASKDVRRRRRPEHAGRVLRGGRADAGLIAAGYTISSALRPQSEEESGRVEGLLATGLSRSRWYLGYALVTVVGSLAVALAAGVGIGVGYAAVTGDGSAVLRLTGATFSQISGLLLLGALARLLYGVASRWAVLSWLALVFCYVVLLFGTLLDFPGWVIDVSPFSHLAAVPAEPMSWGPFVLVLAVALAMSAGGLVAFRRRDLH